MASWIGGGRRVEDRQPDGGARPRQVGPREALWGLADAAPETVRQAIRAQWAGERDAEPPKE